MGCESGHAGATFFVGTRTFLSVSCTVVVMETSWGGAPIEETFGAHGTSVTIWPQGVEGSEGRAFGILCAAELHTDAAEESMALEAQVRGITPLDVLEEVEAEQDSATRWVEARGLWVDWEQPVEQQSSVGIPLRQFGIHPQVSGGSR